MTIFATLNPIGSTNPKDLIDNAQNLDYLILGPLLSYPDRRGVNRLSWAGIEASFAAAQAQRTSDFNAAQVQRAADYAASEASRGYENPVPYVAGIALTRVTQLVQYSSELYKAKAGTLPWTTTGVWATDSTKLVSVGDAALRQELANDSDPAKGPGKLGFDRDTVYPPGTAGVALRGADVTPWERADLLTFTPGIDPAGWDWSPAINALLAERGEVSLGKGGFGVLSPLVVKPGCRVKGKGPGHAGGAAYSNIFASRIIALAGFTGDSVFTSQVTSPENVFTAPQLEQFRLDLSQCSSHGIHFHDVYDGVKLDNVHVVGAPLDKYACWLEEGLYGLGQTLLMTNCQFLRRPNSTSTLPVALFEALNESNIIGSKFFGSSGGVFASAGAAVEFSGCSGMTMVGCSAAFAVDGVLLSDHPTRKTIGFSMISPTFEALNGGSAFKARGSSARKATEVHLVAPRYYDSVFTMLNAIDVDYVEQSDFDCSFKKAVVGSGADQNTIYIQRQNMVTNSGVNTLVFSRPNASDLYYGINQSLRVSGVIISAGGIAHKTRTFVASTGQMLASDEVLIVNRTSLANYTLPFANQFGSGETQVVQLVNIGSGSANFNVDPPSGDTINGGATFSLAGGAKAILVSDGVSAWVAK